MTSDDLLARYADPSEDYRWLVSSLESLAARWRTSTNRLPEVMCDPMVAASVRALASNPAMPFGSIRALLPHAEMYPECVWGFYDAIASNPSCLLQAMAPTARDGMSFQQMSADMALADLQAMNNRAPRSFSVRQARGFLDLCLDAWSGLTEDKATLAMIANLIGVESIPAETDELARLLMERRFSSGSFSRTEMAMVVSYAIYYEEVGMMIPGMTMRDVVIGTYTVVDVVSYLLDNGLLPTHLSCLHRFQVNVGTRKAT